MAIFGILMALVMGIVIRMSQQAADNMTRVHQVEEVRLGIMQIDRQVRSGNVISDPALESPTASGVPTGYSLRVFAQNEWRPQVRAVAHRLPGPGGVAGRAPVPLLGHGLAERWSRRRMDRGCARRDCTGDRNTFCES